MESTIEQGTLASALSGWQPIGQMNEGPGSGTRVGDRLGHRGRFLQVGLEERQHDFPENSIPKGFLLEFHGLELLEDARRIGRHECSQDAESDSVIPFFRGDFPERLDEPPGHCP